MPAAICMPPVLKYEDFINKTVHTKNLILLCSIINFYFLFFRRVFCWLVSFEVLLVQQQEAYGRRCHADIGVCLSWYLQSTKLSNIILSIMIILLKVNYCCYLPNWIYMYLYIYILGKVIHKWVTLALAFHAVCHV